MDSLTRLPKDRGEKSEARDKKEEATKERIKRREDRRRRRQTLMSKYALPRRAPMLPQGDYAYCPQVRIFGPFGTTQELENAVNAWFQAIDQLPDIRVDSPETQYQITGTGTAISHAAMITYTEIKNI